MSTQVVVNGHTYEKLDESHPRAQSMRKLSQLVQQKRAAGDIARPDWSKAETSKPETPRG